MLDRILIVGHGSIGRRHLRIVRQVSPQADIRVLRRASHSDTPRFADGCFFNLEEAQAFRAQAAIIANPSPFHLDTARALGEGGTHLLVEKPLAHERNGVAEVLERLREKKVLLQVGYNLRFMPALQKFREYIHAGLIGRILSVRCEAGQYLPSWRPHQDYRQTVSARKELGGGVLLELSHELDYMRWIFGEVAWSQAWLGNQGLLEIDVEDTAHLTLGFQPDVSGHAPTAAVAIDFIRHDATRLCTAIGEHGSLKWDGRAGTVELARKGKEGWERLFSQVMEPDDSYLAQWLDFLRCVREGCAPSVTGEDGLAVLEIVAAVQRSSITSGARVYVANPPGEVVR